MFDKDAPFWESLGGDSRKLKAIFEVSLRETLVTLLAASEKNPSSWDIGGTGSWTEDFEFVQVTFDHPVGLLLEITLPFLPLLENFIRKAQRYLPRQYRSTSLVLTLEDDRETKRWLEETTEEILEQYYLRKDLTIYTDTVQDYVRLSAEIHSDLEGEEWVMALSDVGFDVEHSSTEVFELDWVRGGLKCTISMDFDAEAMLQGSHFQDLSKHWQEIRALDSRPTSEKLVWLREYLGGEMPRRSLLDSLLKEWKNAPSYEVIETYIIQHRASNRRGSEVTMDLLSKDEFRQMLAKKETDKDSKYEEGENVPLKDLPKELQENVENPPPSVKKLKRKLENKKGRLRLTARHPKGVPVPRDKLPPAFVEQIDSEAALKLREEMKSKKKKSAADLTADKFRASVRRFASAALLLQDDYAELSDLYKVAGAVTVEEMLFDSAYPFADEIGKVARGIMAWDDALEKFAKKETDKDSKYEEGEDVPLKDLPKELQENVKNPPPGVKKLKQKLEAK